MDQGGASGTVEPVPTALSPGARQTPGDLLREGRERRGLTVQQIADEMHLEVRLVQAIEANDFLLLGAPVYAKGHLRKYASVLGLVPETVIAHYDKLSNVPVTPVVVPAATAHSPHERRRSLRIPALIIGGVLVAAAALWIAAWVVDQMGGGGGSGTAQNTIQIPAAQNAEPRSTVPVTVNTVPRTTAPTANCAAGHCTDGDAADRAGGTGSGNSASGC